MGKGFEEINLPRPRASEKAVTCRERMVEMSVAGDEIRVDE